MAISEEREPTREEALTSALSSVMDVVEELCQGLAWGQRPQKDWAEVVVESFEKHRVALRIQRQR